MHSTLTAFAATRSLLAVFDSRGSPGAAGGGSEVYSPSSQARRWHIVAGWRQHGQGLGANIPSVRGCQLPRQRYWLQPRDHAWASIATHSSAHLLQFGAGFHEFCPVLGAVGGRGAAALSSKWDASGDPHRPLGPGAARQADLGLGRAIMGLAESGYRCIACGGWPRNPTSCPALRPGDQALPGKAGRTKQGQLA